MNLRVIKKDIDFLIDEFLSDALIGLSFAQDDAKRESITNVINEAVELRHETFAKINHPEKENVKAFYNKTNEGFLNSLDLIYDKLSEAVKAQAPEKKAPAKKAPAKKAAAPAEEKVAAEKKAPAKKAPAKKAPAKKAPAKKEAAE